MGRLRLQRSPQPIRLGMLLSSQRATSQNKAAVSNSRAPVTRLPADIYRCRALSFRLSRLEARHIKLSGPEQRMAMARTIAHLSLTAFTPGRAYIRLTTSQGATPPLHRLPLTDRRPRNHGATTGAKIATRPRLRKPFTGGLETMLLLTSLRRSHAFMSRFPSGTIGLTNHAVKTVTSVRESMTGMPSGTRAIKVRPEAPPRLLARM
jgi:hypothetical protein